MGAPVIIRYLTRDEYSEWTDLVINSPDGSVYSLPAYLDVLCSVTGGIYDVLAAERGGNLLGGVALYQQKSTFGTFLSPRVLLYYNGIVLARHEAKTPSQRTTWRLHALAALEGRLAKLPYARVRLKSRSTLTDLRSFSSRGWTLRPTWSYVLNITDLSVAWSRMHKDQRRLIERCRERGLALTVDDDFDAFHRLHRQIHERKGAPLYLPRDAYQRYVEGLQRNSLARLYHARMPDGRVAASQLVLTGPHPVTHTVCCASDNELLRFGASAFLRWAVCERLAADGYEANDLTDAQLNPVTRFKGQLGGDLVLSLEISRRDHLLFGANQFAARLRGRTKRGLLRAYSSLHGKAR